MINIKKLDSNAVLPTRGSEYAAGWDLHALNPEEIAPQETKKVGTGIAIQIPDGYFGAIFARSGLATKQGLRPANCVGVVDQDYRGELIVALHNDSNVTRSFEAGERIAQLVLIPYLNFDGWNEVDDLNKTKRGSGGFGSTGTK